MGAEQRAQIGIFDGPDPAPMCAERRARMGVFDRPAPANAGQRAHTDTDGGHHDAATATHAAMAVSGPAAVGIAGAGALSGDLGAPRGAS